MATWQFEVAKRQLSIVVGRAFSDGAQVIARDGVEAGVVSSMEEFRKLTGSTTRSLRQVLLERVGNGLISDEIHALVNERRSWAVREPLDLDD
jgi:hypothetical protein